MDVGDDVADEGSQSDAHSTRVAAKHLSALSNWETDSDGIVTVINCSSVSVDGPSSFLLPGQLVVVINNNN